jgi:hypothetical protein
MAASRAEVSVPHVREIGDLIHRAVANRGYAVDYRTALSVPAVQKALKTYTHTISAFPLRQYDAAGAEVARPFLRQPCPDTTYAADLQRTVSDLLMFDRAYWRVTERSWDNFPSATVRMPVQEVSDPAFPADYGETPPVQGILWNGVPIPDRDVIRFDGDGTGGWLQSGATIILTAAALEAATMRYSETPMPSVVLKNSGPDLPGDIVDALLDQWESSRTNRSTAYLNSTIDAQSVGGFSPSELQLVEGRNASAIAVARMANLDPTWVGAGVPGASLVYSNRVDLYRQLLDLSLTPIMRLIDERLSMNDCSPRGHRVRFDPSVFLRANPTELAPVIATLVPLGIISEAEARDLLDLPNVGALT